MNNTTAQIQFEELDEMEAPSWESFYTGVIVGVGVIGLAVMT